MMFLQILLLALAGGIGAGGRYALDIAVRRAAGPSTFPLGIPVVNISGSAALGCLYALGQTVLDPGVVHVLGAGLLGGYTTFSTASVDTSLLFLRGARRSAWTNLLLTPISCVLAAGVALLLTTLAVK